MIAMHEVTRRYGSNTAVDAVSTEVQRGEVVGLLGHNGAGKTTLMKMLTGVLEPSSGSIAVDGHDVVDARAEAQRRIGYLPENAPLYPEMLVQEYLLGMAELRGVPADRRVAQVGDAVVRTGLQKHLLAPISTLSKGFRQRVGIAQAMVHKPDVLVLDEPTNGLDPMQIQAIRELIRGLAKTTTILLSTHILQEVEAVCDRVLVMIGGKLVADSPLVDLTRSRTVRVVLLGAPAAELKLRDVPGVSSVRRLAAADLGPDREGYDVDFGGAGELPVADILAVGSQHGWRFAGVAPEPKSLDRVFRELQDRAAAGGAA